jgi:hypothetical protein
MSRIRSKQELTDYIKSQLGYPTINIEVTDSQIGEIIDDAVQKFTEYAYGTLEDVIILQINGAGTYDMPDRITNIIKLSRGNSGSNILNFNVNFGAGLVPNIWSEQFFTGGGSIIGNIIENLVSISANKSVLERFFGDDIVYNFNHLSKKMKVLENFVGAAALHYQYEYLANESDDLVYNHEWIKGYCISKTKFLWGTVTGKYDQTLIGGSRINYSDMKNEAGTEIERWDEQLLSKWSDPCPISVA